MRTVLRNCYVSQALIALLATELWSGSAAAQTESAGALPEPSSGDIMVTARKTPELLRTAPLAVTSISAEAIETNHLRSTDDLARVVPNLSISGGIAAGLQGQIGIRGISTLVRNIGTESGTGVYVDGVYVGRPENFIQPLLDVDRVEIARGPQGTEYGKNTIAGVIQIHTRQPDASDQGFIEAEIGNYNLGRIAAAAGGRLNEALSARAAFSYTRQDGTYKHISGGPDAGSTDVLNWRVAGKLDLANVTFTLRGDGLRDRGTPGFFQADALVGFPSQFPSNRPHRINNNRPNRLSRDSNGVSLSSDWTNGDTSVVSIAAFRTSKYRASVDDDQEQIDFVAADDFGDDAEFFSHELRVSGRRGSVQYLLGTFYLDQTVSTDRRIAIGADLGIPGEPSLTTRGRINTRSLAAFARADITVVRDLTVSTGIRFTNERKVVRFTQGDQTGIFTFLGFPNLTYDGRANDSDVSPTVALSYKISDDVNVYGRFAQGFKSAAFNVDLVSSLEKISAAPEKARSYEIGAKSSLFDNRVALTVAAFRVDYDQLQVSQVLGNGIALTNAGQARTQGLETELAIKLTEQITFNGSAAVLDASYEQFANCGVPLSLGGGIADCSGNTLAIAPRFSAFAALQFTQPLSFGRFSASIDLDHRSSVFFEPTNSAAFRAGPRTLLNIRAAVDLGLIDISAWVHNAGNATYKTYLDDRSALGVLRTVAYGSPRTFGFGLRHQF